MGGGGGGRPRHAKLVLFVTLGRQPNQELDLRHKVDGFSKNVPKLLLVLVVLKQIPKLHTF